MSFAKIIVPLFCVCVRSARFKRRGLDRERFLSYQDFSAPRKGLTKSHQTNLYGESRLGSYA